MDFFYDLDFLVELDIVFVSLLFFVFENFIFDGFYVLESNIGKVSIVVIQNIIFNWDVSVVSWNIQLVIIE